jgi:hypothetical protein
MEGGRLGRVRGVVVVQNEMDPFDGSAADRGARTATVGSPCLGVQVQRGQGEIEKRRWDTRTVQRIDPARIVA